MAAVATVGEGLFELGVDEDDPDRPLRRGYGGDAANTAVAAARFGAEARLCSRVGADALGRELVAFWRGAGVDTRWVVVDDGGPTGIYVNERLTVGGNRFHYHRRGSAGSRLVPADVGDDFLAGVGFVHSTGVTLAISASAADAARAAFRSARARGIAVSFAANHRPALGGDVSDLAAEARAANVVFVSREEAPAVLGAGSPEEIVRALGRGPREVVVTAGAGGALVSADGAVSTVAAPPTDVVDAPGAGDALAGVYLVSRLTGLAPDRALARAVAAASLSCGAFGCARSYPDAASVDSLLAAAP
jgi:2-dehydro-3-deoxygluconokinase